MKGIADLNRADLPEEGGRGSQRGGRGQSTGGPGGRGPTAGGPGGAARGGTGIPGGNSNDRRGLVKYYGFDFSVLCKPDGLRDVLKNITAANAPQFYVLRSLKIQNQMEKGPSRAGDPNKPEKDKELASYIVGTELIEVSAHFEVVDFSNPGETVESEASPSTSPKTTPARR
ncbi:hypothetical protein CfE428DRAFT_4609 [Chthoniobacter flavus Ellin428]|uniref:Uncharacterized protein n=1 Tax=Chthoniobacter flavus Ellin428 TaxID=497964 RepID=B4D6R9_9BACT|nr:hypothetical protein CfE428DRAFT_4609 [Chthoniobacter flavus Ellin428]